jgi:hypothetical protein
MGQTLDAIRDKLSPGEMLDQAFNYFKSRSSNGGDGVGAAASQWASSLGDTVKENPVPVALIGAGLAWLMMGGSRRPDRPAPRSYTYETAVSSPQGAEDPSEGLRGRAGEMAAGVQERMSAAGERVGDMAAGARESLGNTADRLRDHARQQGGKTKETFNYLRDEQPLVMGALGFALGAALGAGLPPTQREDELMGDTRDELVQRAQEMGQEQLDQAKKIATAASEAAQDQAKQEGLTQDSADQTLRDTTEKVERVAKASVEAAKKEADKQGSASASASTGQRE